MRLVVLAVLAGLPLAACEYDTSPEHLAYCANGGIFGCGRAGGIPPHVCAATGQCGPRPEVGMALLGASAAMMQAQPAPAPPPTPLMVNCTSQTFGNTTRTTCH